MPDGVAKSMYEPDVEDTRRWDDVSDDVLAAEIAELNSKVREIYSDLDAYLRKGGSKDDGWYIRARDARRFMSRDLAIARAVLRNREARRPQLAQDSVTQQEIARLKHDRQRAALFFAAARKVIGPDKVGEIFVKAREDSPMAECWQALD